MKRALAFTLMVLAIMIIAVSCEEPQAHVHTCSEEWSHDDTFHWHASACGHEEEVSDKSVHVWKEGGDEDGWITEKAATETEKGSAYRICTVCEYKETKVIQELTHVHTYSAYDHNGSKHWRTCTGCGEKFTYTHSLTYKYNSATHHQECYCGYSTTETAHTFETSASDGSTLKTCTVCKYQETLTKQAPATADKEIEVEAAKEITIKNKDNEDETVTAAKSTDDVTMKASVTAEETKSNNETKVTFPKGALKVETDENGKPKEVKLTVTTASVSVASLNGSGYQITTNGEKADESDADTKQAVVAGIEFNLEGAIASDLFGDAKESEAQDAKNVGTKVTTYIAKGLTGAVTEEVVADTTTGLDAYITIKYVGTGSGEDAVINSYNNNSGKLEFTVYHFSKYIIVSQKMNVTDSNGNMYETLAAAVTGAADNSTVTLLADVSLESATEIKNSITLNLNGKKVTYTAPGELSVAERKVVTVIGNYTNGALIKKGVKVGSITVDDGVYYPTLKDAVSNVSSGKTITLLESLNTERIDLEDKSLTVVLNGKTLTGTSADGVVFCPKNGNTITIDGSAEGSKIVGTVMCTADTTGNIVVNKGTYEGNDYTPFYVNGNASGTCNLTIKNATITGESTGTEAESQHGLYLAGPNKTVIESCTITGENTGIEVRAGKVTLNNCTITANGSYETPKANDNGSTVIGAAVAVSQHTTKKAITVTIDGGTCTATNGKQLAIVDTLTGSTVENKKLVKVIVKSGVKMTAENIVGVKVGNSDGVDGTYYVDAASALANGADKCNELYEFYKVKVSSENNFPLSYNEENEEIKQGGVVLDGKLDNGNKTVISEWQDLWAYGDVTISNFEFSNGVTISAGYYGKEITIEFKNCIFHGTDQIALFKAAKRAGVEPKANGERPNVLTGDPTFKNVANSRNDMGLIFRVGAGEKEENVNGTVNVIIKDCIFVGKNDSKMARAPGYDNYWSWYDEKQPNKKAHGIGIGSNESNTYHLKSALIDNCTFEGIVSHAIHIEKFIGSIEITNNTFTSYGVNSTNYATDAEEFKDVAIRGVLENGGSLTLSGNKYNNTRDEKGIEITDRDDKVIKDILKK